MLAYEYRNPNDPRAIAQRKLQEHYLASMQSQPVQQRTKDLVSIANTPGHVDRYHSCYVLRERDSRKRQEKQRLILHDRIQEAESIILWEGVIQDEWFVRMFSEIKMAKTTSERKRDSRKNAKKGAEKLQDRQRKARSLANMSLSEKEEFREKQKAVSKEIRHRKFDKKFLLADKVKNLKAAEVGLRLLENPVLRDPHTLAAEIRRDRKKEMSPEATKTMREADAARKRGERAKKKEADARESKLGEDSTQQE